MKPSNKIKSEFHSKIDSTIKLKYDSNVNSIQRQIQPLNPQMRYVNSNQRRNQPSNTELGFKVNSIQRKIQPLNHKIGFI